ncbi:peroxide stress protein YaaA [Streptomyces sp. XM4011]|uniref:peroxide stress protein YaaA n=1 Tax=Streptomyces sp. XM4011 TaxID=2929780 RepID=UPI001FF96BBD|nr:peroxide stress protein YaaA [Streptomyces sp. XM4011]MCK1816889.1 peroxide stress protein YaaA [Streptomyces sp. XM4011]
MLVLLPPSEGKAAGAGDGAPVRLEALSLPGLTAARETVLAELTDLCAGDPDKAREVLGLGVRLAGEVTRNAALRTAPAAPAGAVYTGVLYDALGLGTLDPAARRRAEASLLIFSGLWGALRVTDRVPAYRCSAGVRLPALGGLAAYWRRPLAAVLPAEAAADGGPLLDLRSAAYRALWKPTGELAERTVTVRVLHGPSRTVVSHFNKATKGRLVRDLLTADELPATLPGLSGALRDLGYTVERPDGDDRQLDIVVDQV